MKQLALIAALVSLTALPAAAQDEGERGLSLMERGAQMFLEGILKEMEPALDELEGLAQEMEPRLRDFADAMGPALADLFDKVDDWSAYHAPEMLPNGDIILRRKVPVDPAAPEPPAGGEIDL